MIMKLRLLTIFLLAFPFSFVCGQSTDTLFKIPDSVRPFTLTNFYDLILKNHPTARQAELLSETARQEIRLARGNFDPKLEAQLSSKQLNGNDYYDLRSASVKIPTWFPVNPSVGVSRNTGPYVNPENYISDQFNYQQVYAGISIPLGRGLITDERRAAVRQAELFKEMTEAEKVKIINKLLLEAAKTYWDWHLTYYNYRLLDRSTLISQEIFNRVKNNYAQGEASAMDTIQAKITWQQRTIERQEALRDFQNSGVELSTMLWDSLGNPLNLDPNFVPVSLYKPEALSVEFLQKLTDNARENHPELRKIEVKINQLQVERKLATENLKPQLNLNYYAINQPIDPQGSSSLSPDDNYKFGVDFSFPLFLRKERSKLALTKLKLSNAVYEQSLTERQIVNSITTTYNQLVNLQLIIESQKDMVLNYERLLAGEFLNLEQGESDLFKINLQQEKLIQAQTKWVKLLTENEKQKAYLNWAAGSYTIVD